MRIVIRHEIEVELGNGVPRAVQHLLLTPQSSSVQTVTDWQLEAPGMDDAAGFIDAFGNRAHLATQTRPEPIMAISATGVVDTHDLNGVVGRLERDPVPALFRRVTPLTKPLSAVLSKFRMAQKDGENIELLHALMARVSEVLGDDGTAQVQSQGAQAQTQAQDRGGAEAADHAHAFVGAARALGIPARFVTGYLSPADGAPASFHAWAEAWDDRLGWIAFDCVLNTCPTDRHVRVATGLDATSAAPVRSVPMAGSPRMLRVVAEAAQ
jgi:hypothetical protein